MIPFDILYIELVVPRCHTYSTVLQLLFVPEQCVVLVLVRVLVQVLSTILTSGSCTDQAGGRVFASRTARRCEIGMALVIPAHRRVRLAWTSFANLHFDGELVRRLLAVPRLEVLVKGDGHSVSARCVDVRGRAVVKDGVGAAVVVVVEHESLREVCNSRRSVFPHVDKQRETLVLSLT